MSVTGALTIPIMDQAAAEENGKDATAGTGEALPEAIALSEANIMSSTGSACSEHFSSGGESPPADGAAAERAADSADPPTADREPAPPTTCSAETELDQEEAASQPDSASEVDPATTASSSQTRTETVGSASVAVAGDTRQQSHSFAQKPRSSYSRPTLSPIVEDKPLDEPLLAARNPPDESYEHKKGSSSSSTSKRMSNQLRTSAIQPLGGTQETESELTDWQLWATQVSELLGYVYNEVTSMSSRLDATEQGLKDLNRRVESSRHHKHREQELQRQLEDVRAYADNLSKVVGKTNSKVPMQVVPEATGSPAAPKNSEQGQAPGSATAAAAAKGPAAAAPSAAAPAAAAPGTPVQVEKADSAGSSIVSGASEETSQQPTDAEQNEVSTCDVWDLHQRTGDVSAAQIESIQETPATSAVAATNLSMGSSSKEKADSRATTVEDLAPRIQEQCNQAEGNTEQPVENSWLVPDDDSVAKERLQGMDPRPLPLVACRSLTDQTETPRSITSERTGEYTGATSSERSSDYNLSCLHPPQDMRVLRAFRFKVHGEAHEARLSHTSHQWELKLDGKTVGSLQRSSFLIGAATSLEYQMKFSIPSSNGHPVNGNVQMLWSAASGKWSYDLFANSEKIQSSELDMDVANEGNTGGETELRELTGLPLEGAAQAMQPSSVPSLMSRMRHLGEALKTRSRSRSLPLSGSPEEFGKSSVPGSPTCRSAQQLAELTQCPGLPGPSFGFPLGATKPGAPKPFDQLQRPSGDS